MFPNKIYPYLGNQVFERAVELGKKYKVRVIAPVPFAPKILKRINPYYKYALIPKQEKIGSILVYHPRYFTFPGMFLYFTDAITYFLATVGLIKKVFSDWRFDLIDAHQAFPDGFVATLIADKLFPKPKIVTIVHGGDVYTPRYSLARRLIILKGIKASDLVIAVSETVKSKLKLIAPKANIITIPIGVQIPNQIKELPAQVKSKIKNKFVILSVSNLIKRKGQIYVLKAVNELVKKYKNIFLVIIGSGPEYDNLCNFVRVNRLEKYVYFTGAIPNNEAQSYFKASDVFVLPSWDEALGIVYMEAMIHGKPPLGCHGGGAAELITDDVDGFLVEPRNIIQITKNIEKLIVNPKLQERMGRAAKLKAKKAYRLDDRIKDISTQFDNMINKNIDYKNIYSENYYIKQGERFDLIHHNIFSIFFKKFKFKEPILDLGCATGLFMQEAKCRGYKKVVGIDISKYAINKARKNNLETYYYDGNKIPFNNNSFNTVFCYQVIEHVPRSKANSLLKECYRVLKTGGRLFLFAPAEYQEGYNTDPTHINFYPIKYFQSLITDLGFQIKSFESTALLPAVIRNIQPFSYIISKYLYKIFRKRGTTIEMEAIKS